MVIRILKISNPDSFFRVAPPMTVLEVTSTTTPGAMEVEI